MLGWRSRFHYEPGQEGCGVYAVGGAPVMRRCTMILEVRSLDPEQDDEEENPQPEHGDFWPELEDAERI